MFNKFGFSGSSEFFKKLGDGVGKGLFILCAALGTVFLTIGGAYAGSYDFSTEWKNTSENWDYFILILFNPNSALIFGGTAFLFGAVGTYKDQDKQKLKMEALEIDNNKLSETKSALNLTQEELQEKKSRILELHGELVKTWLKGLSKYLELDSNSRVTIYYEHDEEFYLLERHSKNPKYAKVHRQKFPLNQGVISKAWEHDTHKEVECPHSEEKAYTDYLHQNYDYDIDKIASLTMKSCRYYAKAIIDADVHIGVIVFEGTEIHFFENDLEKQINDYCHEHQGQLSKFVRDSLSFDKEVNIKRKGKSISVEDEFLLLMEEN
ncbi:MAG: hypothetical protein V5789_13190 [Colwellia sp.]